MAAGSAGRAKCVEASGAVDGRSYTDQLTASPPASSTRMPRVPVLAMPGCPVRWNSGTSAAAPTAARKSSSECAKLSTVDEVYCSQSTALPCAGTVAEGSEIVSGLSLPDDPSFV